MGIGTSKQSDHAQLRAAADSYLSGPLPIKGVRDLVFDYACGFSGTKKLVLQHTSFVWRVVFIDDHLVVTHTDDGLQLWDLKTGAVAFELCKYARDVNNIVLLGNGKLAAAELRGFMFVWDLTLKTCDRAMDVPSFFPMVAFGQEHLIMSSTNPWAQVIHATTGRVEKKIAHPDWVRAIAVVNEEQIATGCDDEVVRLWDLATSTCLREFRGHAGLVSCLTLWNGKLVSGSADQTVRVWDIKTGDSEILHGHTSKICSLVAVNGDLCSVSDNDFVLVWSPDGTNKVIVDNSSGRVSGVASRKKKLAVCVEKQVVIWE